MGDNRGEDFHGMHFFPLLSLCNDPVCASAVGYSDIPTDDHLLACSECQHSDLGGIPTQLPAEFPGCLEVKQHPTEESSPNKQELF